MQKLFNIHGTREGGKPNEITKPTRIVPRTNELKPKNRENKQNESGQPKWNKSYPREDAPPSHVRLGRDGVSRETGTRVGKTCRAAGGGGGGGSSDDAGQPQIKYTRSRPEFVVFPLFTCLPFKALNFYFFKLLLRFDRILKNINFENFK